MPSKSEASLATRDPFSKKGSGGAFNVALNTAVRLGQTDYKFENTPKLPRASFMKKSKNIPEKHDSICP